MGAETIALAAIAGASLIGGTATSIRSNSYAKHSAEEASAEAYERQNEQYEKYLSPSAMADQYAKAGVNPASALASHSVPGMGSVPQTQLPNLVNPVPDFAQTADIMTRSLSQLKDSHVKDEQIRNLMAQTIGQEFANGASEMLNELMEKYGDQKWASEIRDLAASAFMKYAQGGLAEADYDLKNIIRLISNEELGMKREDAAQYSLKLGKLLKLLDAQTANEYAGASEHSANARTINALRPYQTEAASIANSISRVDKRIALASEPEKLQAVISKLEADKNVSDELKIGALVELDKLRRTLSMYKAHPNKARLDATLNNFNKNFPILSQLSAFAGAAK